MPGTDTPKLFQGAFRQLNKFFVVISVNLYLTRGHYISVGKYGEKPNVKLLKMDVLNKSQIKTLDIYIEEKN